MRRELATTIRRSPALLFPECSLLCTHLRACAFGTTSLPQSDPTPLPKPLASKTPASPLPFLSLVPRLSLNPAAIRSDRGEEKRARERSSVGLMASVSGVSSAAETDGPVLSVISKRLRALRKKHNRILQTEESLAQGKPLNKEQEELLRSKTAVTAQIDELEKLRSPLAAAIQEELSRHPSPPPEEPSLPPPPAAADPDDKVLKDLLRLLYFSYLFDVKPQSEFTAMMLTRMHERDCCLTYDYVTDDATDLLVEQDLNTISALGSLMTSRPASSGVSHKNALQGCVQHARLWLQKSDQPIHPGASVTCI